MLVDRRRLNAFGLGRDVRPGGRAFLRSVLPLRREERQTSSTRAMGALSPGRGPSFKMRR